MSLQWVMTRVRARIPVPAWRVMRGGYEMHLHPASDPLERRLYVCGDYEPATLELMNQMIGPGDVVVDVGANLGLMTLHAAKLVGDAGKVIAIEPHPIYFERLKRNIDRNRLTNVTAVNAGAGAEPGELKIFDMPGVNIGRSSLIDPGEGGKVAGATRIRTLDEILGGLSPTFIKIDVEGFEAEVLRGAPKALLARPVICMELATDLPASGGPLEAHDIIMATGLYDCFKFAGSKFEQSPLVPLESRDELAAFHDNLVYLPADKDQSRRKQPNR